MPANSQMPAAVSRTAKPTQGSSSRSRTSGRLVELLLQLGRRLLVVGRPAHGAVRGDHVERGIALNVVGVGNRPGILGDRKSTRLNSSHPSISYAVFCLKKK